MKNKKLLTMVLAAAMVVGSITVPAPMATVKAAFYWPPYSRGC